MAITASLLYDLVHCPHRVSMNLFEEPARKDAVSRFVELLWERGTTYEKEVIDGLGSPFTDLSGLSGDAKRDATSDAMTRADQLIYAGRVEADELIGEPDLLRREGKGYVPIDIKAGRGEEGGGDDDEGKPKIHYTVQLGLYLDILERLGVTGERVGYIWDIHGKEVAYKMDELYGVKAPRTRWEDYKEAMAAALDIIGRKATTAPALASFCKLCAWRSACLERLEAANDLTLIPELGRLRRDTMLPKIATVQQLAKCDPSNFVRKTKTEFPGIGPEMLIKFHDRAKLLCQKSPVPYLVGSLNLPTARREIFFDIEVDPLRDVCYLHGFVTRVDGDDKSEKYTFFFADDASAKMEEAAFHFAWDFLCASKPYVMYFYSKYERTIYRKLQEKYPNVCSKENIEALFDPMGAVDLYYDAVQKGTYWPTRDHSLKTLASFLGFKWRDTEPSGAASIEWYDRWINERMQPVKQRILEYNEDDCRATRVLLDGLRNLRVGAG